MHIFKTAEVVPARSEATLSLSNAAEHQTRVLPLPRRKADIRLPGKGDSNSHDARPVHLIVSMLKWIRTSRSSIKNPLFLADAPPSSDLGTD